MARFPFPRRAVSVLLPIALAALLGACATTPVPVEKMAVAEAAVQRANTATTSETAAMQLRVATDKLAAARAALAAGDPGRAGRLAEQAQLDAQVAELHAQSTLATKAAKDTEDAARVLREEINRKTIR